MYAFGVDYTCDQLLTSNTIPTISKLNIPCMYIHEHSKKLGAIIPKINELKEISLYWSNIEEDKFERVIDGIIRHNNIQTLILNTDKFDMDMCISKLLAANTNLEKLILNSSKKVNAPMMMFALNRSRSLKTVNFRDLKYTPETCAALETALAYNESIEELNLGCTSVDISSAIAGFTPLRKVNLYCSEITVDRMKPLAAALKNNCTLEELLMENTYLEVESFKLLADGLSGNRCLRVLDISGNEKARFEHFKPKDTVLEELSMRYADSPEDKAMFEELKKNNPKLKWSMPE
jgi:hypothetical protein